MEYIDSSVRDAFKTKATENGRSIDFINVYMLIYEFADGRRHYDYDKREKFFHDLKDFTEHFEGEGIVGSNSELRDWDFERKIPFYEKGDVECISIMAPEDDYFVRRLLDALNPLDYSIEYKKMAPRKITKAPKDAYETEVEVGDVIVFEGSAVKVTKIISDKTVNRPRMFTSECVVIRTNNPNKKLGWIEYIDKQ